MEFRPPLPPSLENDTIVDPREEERDRQRSRSDDRLWYAFCIAMTLFVGWQAARFWWPQ